MKLAAKLLVGAGLMAYVVHSGMIDFALLRTRLFHPSNVAVGIGFLALIALCSSMRWFLLIRAQGLTLSVHTVVELTMIGNFFNTFMPGAVGGDLVKAWYVAGREPRRKTRAILTVLLDRAIGLAVFFLFAAGALLAHYDWLSHRLELRVLAASIWAVCGGLGVAAALFFAPNLDRLSPVRAVADRLGENARIAKLLDALMAYRTRFKSVAGALILSSLSITASVAMYRIQGDSIGIPLSLGQYFFVIPVALTISAVPLLPGGIGVGQVAFFTLFQWMGLASPEQGSTLCTVVQIYSILFNCLGAIFYVRFKRTPGSLPDSVSAAME